jgi:hypothetical protein
MALLEHRLVKAIIAMSFLSFHACSAADNVLYTINTSILIALFAVHVVFFEVYESHNAFKMSNNASNV